MIASHDDSPAPGQYDFGTVVVGAGTAGCSNCSTQTVPDFFGRGMFTAPSEVVHGATCVGSFPSGDAWDAAGDTSVLP